VERQPNLYLSDLMTGLLVAMAMRRKSVFSLRDSRIDRAMSRLFADVQEESERAGLRVRFRIQPHPIHGDSPAVHQALRDARKRDLASLDNPEFQDVRGKLHREDAAAYFEGLPGSPEMYQRLADKFLQYYYEA